jgi:hypothetical protein
MAVPGLACDAVPQQRTTGYGFGVPVGNRQPREQTPPAEIGA